MKVKILKENNMGRKRNMPTKKAIHEYWKDKINITDGDFSCFKCGFNKGIEKAHIKAVCIGGNDDVGNIHLLCRNCHLDSEVWHGDAYYIWLNSLNKIDFCNKLAYSYFIKKINLDSSLEKKLDILRNNFIKTYNHAAFIKALKENNNST